VPIHQPCISSNTNCDVGSNRFALAFGARSVTDTRGELGIRTDKSIAAQNGVFTLRRRLGWAHDFDPDRVIGVAL
jgi:uncharacterized protein with beta-barrel porin domain